MDPKATPVFRQLALRLLSDGQQHLLPCHPSSVYRWRRDIARKAKTGGQKPWILRGEHEVLLCFYRMIYPKAQAADAPSEGNSTLLTWTRGSTLYLAVCCKTDVDVQGF